MSGGSALIGAGLGAGGAAGYQDYKAAKSAKKAQKKQIKSANDAYLSALGTVREKGSAGLTYQKQGLKAVQAGNSKASKIAAGLGTSAYNRVLDREQQTKGDLQQRSVNSGLYSTTSLDAANRGVMSDTNRALAEITDSIGGIQTGIAQQGGALESGAYQNLARYLQSQGISEAAIYEALASFLGGIQHTPGPSALGGLAGIAKLGISAFGGGAGAGGGNAIAGTGGGIY